MAGSEGELNYFLCHFNAFVLSFIQTLSSITSLFRLNIEISRPLYDYVTVKCIGESEIDVELEEDRSLALSSLKAVCANATGLCFTSENGTRRSVRVVDKCFPPQGKWGERVYEVVVPETDVNKFGKCIQSRQTANYLSR